MSKAGRYRLDPMEVDTKASERPTPAAGVDTGRAVSAPAGAGHEAMTSLASEDELAAAASALAGPDTPLTAAEHAAAHNGKRLLPGRLQPVRRAISRGEDPLGSAFCRLRSPQIRRKQGAVYTPRPLVDAMIAWAAGEGRPPRRIVDPGAGSGRFLLAAGKVFPRAELVGVEIDPLAALTLRANATVLNMASRLTVHVADYRSVTLPAADGPTLFLGNPPYVRHHEISAGWKDWMADLAASYGLKASKLAGLHVHFFLKTRELARAGDYGAFVTSAEWLDVNYGAVLRKLFTNGLGGALLHVIAPRVMPFTDAATTGAIACFRIGSEEGRLRLRSVTSLADLGDLRAGQPVSWARLDKTPRWSALLRPASRAPRGRKSLGELCRVHRGQVTGCNAVWIAGDYPGPLPQSVSIPAVTKARELFRAGLVLASVAGLRRVIDLPADLDELEGDEYRQVRPFLDWARQRGADQSYVARHRKAWWAVTLRPPAPILCTYMARRPTAFARNPCGARHLNIAHGIYPRDPLPALVLDALCAWLQDTVCVSSGRTYAGGLTKFEPRELERIPIPSRGELHERAEELDAGRADDWRGNVQGVVQATAAG